MKAFLAIPILVLTSCLMQKEEMICETKNKAVNKNITAKQKAVLALCPAALNVGDAYHVYILLEDKPLEEYGIVFSLNDWDNVLPRDTSKIKMKWISGDTLKISYPKSMRVLNQVVKTRDNVIVYEETNYSK